MVTDKPIARIRDIERRLLRLEHFLTKGDIDEAISLAGDVIVEAEALEQELNALETSP